MEEGGVSALWGGALLDNSRRMLFVWKAFLADRAVRCGVFVWAVVFGVWEMSDVSEFACCVGYSFVGVVVVGASVLSRCGDAVFVRARLRGRAALRREVVCLPGGEDVLFEDVCGYEVGCASLWCVWDSLPKGTVVSSGGLPNRKSPMYRANVQQQ